MLKIQICPLQPDHWPVVKRIYEQGIATGKATFQTAAPATWQAWDRGHHQHSRLVAIENTSVLGWVALSPVSSRPCYSGVCEFSLYIDEQARGKGIGSLLMQKLIEESEANGVWTLYSSTFRTNEASIRLQKKFGFREIGYREKIAQFNAVWLDTVLFERRSKKVGI